MQCVGGRGYCCGSLGLQRLNARFLSSSNPDKCQKKGQLSKSPDKLAACLCRLDDIMHVSVSSHHASGDSAS